jgi:predicted nucleic acid-binding protein
MARYFLDTGVLVGLTFLHDLWHDEATRLFTTDNSLYTSRTPVYEYCNSTKRNSIENSSVDWDTEEGVFGDKLSKVRVAQMNLDLKYRTYQDEDLDLKMLVDDFITETGIDREIFPERLIEQRIRPNIRSFLEELIDGEDLTCEIAREALDVLCDTIQNEARIARSRILERVTEYPEADVDFETYLPRLRFVDGTGDQRILSTVAHLVDQALLRKIVTADKSHMYGNRERLRSVCGIHVVYLKDEFANHRLPSESSPSISSIEESNQDTD